MRILLAEDEVEMSRAVTAVLSANGYEVDAAYDGMQALEMAGQNAYDAMVFDIMMPGMDGITAVKSLREAGDVTPVIFLTAKAQLDDRIEGLDAGADDYLTKPFAMKELLARIRSMTRRREGYVSKQVTVGSVTLKTDVGELAAENSVRLAGKEIQLMEMFMRSPGKSFTTDQILTHIWQEDKEQSPDIVWVYISYLRSKLKSIYADVQILGDEGGSFVLSVG
ncbi:MAG: response regulator transcription factor [Lachnospiraceae bacterium]|nr:response regulator transcription factor [Lachnospiraceae bacterium]